MATPCAIWSRSLHSLPNPDAGGETIRILVCNNRYFVSGGPERYMFSVMDLLRGRGHAVVPFSMRYSKNLDTPYARYFTAPPAGEDLVYLEDRPLNLREKLGMFGRILYNPAVVRDVQRVIAQERIDLVYTLQVAHYLYPGVVLGAVKAGVPVVSRLSDFSLIAPCYTLFRDEPCTKCVAGGRWRAVLYGCVRDSRAVSLARVAAMAFHGLLGAREKIDAFVTPSRFTGELLAQDGVHEARIHHVPTFVDPPTDPEGVSRGRAFLYAGNLFAHKGVATLIKAVSMVPEAELLIAGDAGIAQGPGLVRLARDLGIEGNRVRFVGHLDKGRLGALYAGSLATVVPSEWFENMPNAALESMSHGTPVIAGRIGSLPEIVEDRINGLLFSPGDADSLAEVLRWSLTNPEELAAFGQRARLAAAERHSPQKHYEELIAVFESVLSAPPS